MTYISARLREQARERAGQRCEYCRQPEGYGARGHQIDHIIPQKHGGETQADNLAWSCFQYNIMKGSEVAAYSVFQPTLTTMGRLF
jgi:5-methylcytosine-specific restriction endonuclease McrA